MMDSHPVNARTVQRLQDLTEAMESGQIIGERFGAYKVRLNLVPEPYSPDSVRETRELLRVSQKLFATLMGVTASAVQQWERGDKSPSRTACRLMDEMRSNPDYWQKRFISAVEFVS